MQIMPKNKRSIILFGCLCMALIGAWFVFGNESADTGKPLPPLASIPESRKQDIKALPAPAFEKKRETPRPEKPLIPVKTENTGPVDASISQSGQARPAKPRTPEPHLALNASVSTKQAELEAIRAHAGNLGVRTALQAHLDELRLMVAIEEQNSKLNHANSLSQLEQQLSLPPVQKEDARPKRQMAVVSVQGVDGDLSATIRTESGTLVTVREKEKLNGATVTFIGRESVRIGNHTLSFE